MTEERVASIKKKVLRNYSSWVVAFNVDTYVRNPELIKTLNEQKNFAELENLELKERIEVLQKEINNLQLNNQEIATELKSMKRNALTVFLAGILAIIMASIGANIFTSGVTGIDSNAPGSRTQITTGIILVVFAVLIEIIVYFSKPRGQE